MTAPLFPTDAVDWLVLLLPSLLTVATTVRWRNEKRRRTRAETKVQTRGDRIAELTQQLSEAGKRAEQGWRVAGEWRTAWQVEAARSLSLDATTEARSN